MSRLIVLFAVLAAALVGTASAHAATAAQTCKPPSYPGTGYFTSLSVKGTSCATGRKFVVAYYKCRLAHGKAGRCVKKVMGYSCQEKRETIPTEIDARVTCRDGNRSITHTYQQNT